MKIFVTSGNLECELCFKIYHFSLSLSLSLSLSSISIKLVAQWHLSYKVTHLNIQVWFKIICFQVQCKTILSTTLCISCLNILTKQACSNNHFQNENEINTNWYASLEPFNTCLDTICNLRHTSNRYWRLSKSLCKPLPISFPRSMKKNKSYTSWFRDHSPQTLPHSKHVHNNRIYAHNVKGSWWFWNCIVPSYVEHV